MKIIQYKHFFAIFLLSISMIYADSLNAQFFKGSNYNYGGDRTPIVVTDSAIYLGEQRKLVKLDQAGNLLWCLRNDTLKNFAICRSFDDNIYMLSNLDLHADHFYLSKISANGFLIWTKKYELQQEYLNGIKIKLTPIGEIIMQCTFDISDDLFIKADSLGNFIYGRIMGHLANPLYNLSDDFAVMADGSFYYVGHEFFQDKTIIQKRLPNGLLDFRYAITDTSNPQYYLANNSSETVDNGCILLGSNHVTKLDSAGIIEWCKKYTANVPDYDYYLQSCIVSLPDKSYIISGTIALQSGYDAIFIHKIDSAGNSLWSKFYRKNIGNFTNNSIAYSAISKNIFLSGTFFYNPFCNYIIKTDSLGNGLCNDSSFSFTDEVIQLQVDTALSSTGPLAINVFPDTLIFISGDSIVDLCSTVGIHEIPEIKWFTVAPNPANNTIRVEVIIPPDVDRSCLILYDIFGRLIKKEEITIGMNEASIDLSSYSAGEYILVLSVDSFNARTQKIIVQH